MKTIPETVCFLGQPPKDTEKYMNQMATLIAIKLKYLLDNPAQINQAEAYRQYGRKRVEEWVKQGRLERILTGKDGHAIRYNTEDLYALANEVQDYLYRNVPPPPQREKKKTTRKKNTHEQGRSQNPSERSENEN